MTTTETELKLIDEIARLMQLTVFDLEAIARNNQIINENKLIISKMNKEKKNEFLRNGGTLLRTGKNRKGEYVIKVRTIDRNWHSDIVCYSKTTCDDIINKLIADNPIIFQRD